MSRYSPAELWAAFGAPASAVRAPAIAGKAFEWTLSLEALAALVDIVPNLPTTTRDEWIKVLHGIMGAGGGFDIFEKYSSRWPGYDADATRKAWDETRPDQVVSGGGNLRVMAEATHPTGWAKWRQAWEAHEVFDDLGLLPPPDEAEAEAEVSRTRQKQDAYAKAIMASEGWRLRWNIDRQYWLEFNGAIWKPEPGRKLGLELSWAESARAGPRGKGDADMTVIWFHKGVEEFCRNIRAVHAREVDFNLDGMALGSPGKTTELKMLKVRPGRPEDMISKQTAVDPSDVENCPQWKRFLVEVTKGDLESQVFLQQWAGYCLTGDTTEQKILFLHGPGGNGKSVFCETLEGLWNDYAVTATSELFTKTKHGIGHTSKLAMLQGARLVIVPEVPANAHWNEALLKEVTGGGSITAGYKGQDERTFKPVFKLMAYGNHQPTFPGGISDAIRRRFVMMEWDFKPKVVNRLLAYELKAEWPGIFRWALNGCEMWQRTGLLIPGKAQAATDAMFEAQDLLKQWQDERLEPLQGAKVTATDLFADWISWRNGQGNAYLFNTSTAFGREIAERGLVKAHTKTGTVYQDIALKNPAKGVF